MAGCVDGSDAYTSEIKNRAILVRQGIGSGFVVEFALHDLRERFHDGRRIPVEGMHGFAVF